VGDHRSLGEHPVELRDDRLVKKHYPAGARVEGLVDLRVPHVAGLQPVLVVPGANRAREGGNDLSEHITRVPQPVVRFLPELAAVADEDGRGVHVTLPG
jgi:hypothetical protein